jgi:hypothetical protein
MANIKVCVINACTVLDDGQISSILPALQKQVDRDFLPAWGIGAELSFVGRNGKKPEDTAWWLVILDDSDQANAYGYHDVTNEGLPLGKVFASTDIKSGKFWTVTASHELLEMLIDPELNLTVFDQIKNEDGGILYAYEICDACQSEDLSYMIDGVKVSDFVFPSWFQASRLPSSTQFDFCKHIQAPFEIAPGGYIGTFNIASGSGWQMKKADTKSFQQIRPRLGSRRERRRTLRDLWQKSTVTFMSSGTATSPEILVKEYKKESSINNEDSKPGVSIETLDSLIPVIANTLRPDKYQSRTLDERNNDIKEIARKLAPIVIGLLTKN